MARYAFVPQYKCCVHNAHVLLGDTPNTLLRDLDSKNIKLFLKEKKKAKSFLLVRRNEKKIVHNRRTMGGGKMPDGK